ncbi:hypothetical protein U1Q18_036478 [Sarracenia purpurea var. burkii]
MALSQLYGELFLVHLDSSREDRVIWKNVVGFLVRWASLRGMLPCAGPELPCAVLIYLCQAGFFRFAIIRMSFDLSLCAGICCCLAMLGCHVWVGGGLLSVVGGGSVLCCWRWVAAAICVGVPSADFVRNGQMLEITTRAIAKSIKSYEEDKSYVPSALLWCCCPTLPCYGSFASLVCCYVFVPVMFSSAFPFWLRSSCRVLLLVCPGSASLSAAGCCSWFSLALISAFWFWYW